MDNREKVIEGLKIMLEESKYNDSVQYNPWADTETLEAAIALLKAQEPRVMTLDLPDAEWNDKVIWLEIKGNKPRPCLLRECASRVMFGRRERMMYFDIIGHAFESGLMLKNYGVKWRCWTSRPTDEQREETQWL